MIEWIFTLIMGLCFVSMGLTTGIKSFLTKSGKHIQTSALFFWTVGVTAGVGTFLVPFFQPDGWSTSMERSFAAVPLTIFALQLFSLCVVWAYKFKEK